MGLLTRRGKNRFASIGFLGTGPLSRGKENLFASVGFPGMGIFPEYSLLDEVFNIRWERKWGWAIGVHLLTFRPFGMSVFSLQIQ